MNSLKNNIILSYINTISSVIFPIITFPYAARILQPEGIGLVDFQNSIINYIILLTGLGIPFYGVREIAKYRDNIQLRNKKLTEITLLNLFLCILGYILVFFLSMYVPKIRTNILLFYVLSSAIIFTAIGVQWFYQGIEDFRFITIRGIIIRTLCALSLFIFVKDKNDFVIYGIIVVGSTVGNNVINFVHLKKYISLSKIKWKQLNIFQHLKPAFQIFLMFAFVSIYIYFNIVMLGFMSGEKAVGLFTSGTKILNIINILITSLGAVMLPRCSNLIEIKEEAKFNQIITKSYHFILATSIPMMIFVLLLSEPIILILCGKGFYGSISVIRLTAPTILFVALSNIIGMQILFPKNKEKIVIISTCVASIINVIVNLILIPYFSQNGAAIATLLAELSIIIIEIKLGKKYIPFKFIDTNVYNYVKGAVILFLILLIIHYLDLNIYLTLIISIALGLICYLGYLLYKKDEIAIEILKYLKHN